MDERVPEQQQEQAQRERWELLSHIDAVTEMPMVVLSFVWLALLIVDLTQGLAPLLQTLSTVIWVLFVIDFLIEITIAPSKRDYLRRNWLAPISLLLPALRVFRLARAIRVLRAARAARSLSLIRVLTSLNRGMRAVRRTLGKGGIGYVLALTIVVTLGGAAGMLNFENPAALREAGVQGEGLDTYGESLWWTAMIMTTVGSSYWPLTAEGRILCLLLSLYAFAVFGFITATLASILLGGSVKGESDPEPADTQALLAELRELRATVEALTPTPLPAKQGEGLG